MASSPFGARQPRREDARLITGRGRYVGDVELPRMLHVAFVRSVHAHARLRAVATERAAAAPGVVHVATGAEEPFVRHRLIARSVAPGYVTTGQPILAWPTVRYAGEPLAVVVATDRYGAEDGAMLVDVDGEPLAAAVEAEAAVRDGAPRVHDEAPGNVLLSRRFENGRVDLAMDGAVAVVDRTFRTNRHTAAPMEGRGGVADWDAAHRKLTLWSGTQVPHLARHGLAEALGVPEHAIRVIAPDVGGGFGVKGILYPEDVALCLLAIRLQRPVRWIEQRREHFLACAHARDHRYSIRAGFDADGRLRSLDARALCNTGAYSVFPWTAGIEPLMVGGLLTGPYKLEHYRCEVSAVATNTAPAGPYRGVARPATTFVMERVLDLGARALNLDPVQIRRINLVAKADLPYTPPTRLVHDSGAYPVCFEKVVAALDYDTFRAEQAQLRSEGRYVGIGFQLQRADGSGTRGLRGAADAVPHWPRRGDRAHGPVGRRHRAGRRDVAGPVDRDHAGAGRGRRPRRAVLVRQRRARRHRRHAVRPGRVRLAPGRHRRRRRRAGCARCARKGAAHRGASAGGGGGGSRDRRRDRERARRAGPYAHGRRGRAGGEPRDQPPAARRRSRARGDALLRSDPWHVRGRLTGRDRGGRSGDGHADDPPLGLRGGHRPGHQPDGGRGSGARRDRAGHRRRALRAPGLRRGGPADDGQLHGLRAARGDDAAGVRAGAHRGARRQPARRARRGR